MIASHHWTNFRKNQSKFKSEFFEERQRKSHELKVYKDQIVLLEDMLIKSDKDIKDDLESQKEKILKNKEILSEYTDQK